MMPILTSIPHISANPDSPAMYRPVSDGDKTKWVAISRREFSTQVADVAAALLMLGLEPQQCVGVFSENRPETLLIDFAAWQVRGVPVSIYATSSPEQVKFIVNDAGIRIMMVGSQVHYDAARSAGVEKLIVVSPDVTLHAGDSNTISFSQLLEMGHTAPVEVRNRVKLLCMEAADSDLATLLYTSGTTGEPKGAQLSHANFNAAIRANRQRLTMLSAADTAVCFLPLSHIFELAWTCFCFYLGIAVYVNLDPKRIQQTLREVSPSCMCSVPRFWEKVFTAVQDKINSMGTVSRTMARRAINVGRRRNLDYVRLGLKVPTLLEREYQLYNGRIFRKLRRAIGVDRGNMFPTAGAPLAPEIVEFFHSVGINIVVGYGLSETTATVSCYPVTGYVIGSAGLPLPQVEVRINPANNEIQLRGETVMSGYYNRPEQNAEAFTPDGWFRTGDAGYLDEEGNLYLTDRIKDLFKTSNGKYIAPQALESRLGADPLFEQVTVIGDQRKFVSALIVPDFKALEQMAAEQKLNLHSRRELATNPRIIELVQERIDKLCADLAPYERIKRFALLTEPFSIESGTLTNTMKVRRRAVAEHYADLINSLYAI